jgi:peroxiredoxin
LAYQKRNQKFESGLANIKKAIQLTLAGKGRLHDDMSGKIEMVLLPSMYEILADFEMKQENWPEALAAIKAAQNLKQETNERLSRLEASLWLKLERFSHAERAFLSAWEKGSQIAEDSLKSLYRHKHGDLTGFEDYLQQKMTSKNKAQELKNAAPEFSATSLDNQTFNPASLRGKVVVLNFWYVGCGPCHVEIPSLNKLVDHYQGKPIEFIAIALTDKEKLESFLKKNPFSYHIIPDGEAIAKKFGVKLYPTHIIIDKEGNIAYTASGGSPNIHENLKPMIDRLLH